MRSGFPKIFWVGVWLLVLGTGPLLAIIVAAQLGLTRDSNPNPIGPGLLAFLTFWPSVVLITIGLVRKNRRAPSGAEPPPLDRLPGVIGIFSRPVFVLSRVFVSSIR